MKTNTLYYIDDYVKGKLSDNLSLTLEKEIDTEKLKHALEDNISDSGHRCMSVYRHAFKHNSDIYNVCLSCGDFYKNNELFYLSTNGIEQFKKYL